MRGLIGTLLYKVHNHREDRGLNAMLAGKFESYEQMGIWNRYGMTHEEFDEFHEECNQRAISRYSDYMALVEMLFGLQLEWKEKIWHWYYYTEFYSKIISKRFVR